MEELSAAGAIGVLRCGVDAVLACELDTVSDVELTGLLGDLEAQVRRLEAASQALIGAVADRGLAGQYGCSSMVELLVELLRIDAGEAQARVRRARDLGTCRDLSGQPLPPTLPLVAAAQRAGTISARHTGVITRCLDRLPAHLRGGAAASTVEQFLLDHAQTRPPAQVAREAERLLAHLDQDGAEPREQLVQRRRELNLHVKPDGSAILSGRLTPGACATWRVILDVLSTPQPSHHPYPQQDAHNGGEECGEDDPGAEREGRTAGQRRHDGFLEAGQRLLRSATLPECGGVPVTVLVRVDATQLCQRGGAAETDHGDLLPVTDLLHLAAEAEIIPTVLDDTRGILSYGRQRRVASPKQRRALALRDGGCCFPGCTRPPAWCQAHHITPWADGGTTDLDNLCLLCAHHHREFGKRGWQVRTRHGVPEWTPPAWLDSRQTPRRNRNQHHELHFTHAGPDP